MPQYDESFLLDCEKKRKTRSYKPCKQFAISYGNNLAVPQQDNGTIGKWRKKYFTLKRNASISPIPMPIYRSMCSLRDNSTFNCKFVIWQYYKSAIFIWFYSSVHSFCAPAPNSEKCISCTNASLDSISVLKSVFYFQIGIGYRWCQRLNNEAI